MKNPFANKADLEAAQSQIESLSNDLTAAQAELATERDTVATQAQEITDLQAQISTLTAERDTANDSLTQSQAQIETLQAEVQTAQTSASAKAAEILATAGVPPVDTSTSAEATNHAETYKQLKKSNPAAASAYWQENKESIINQSKI